jgi:hypothetical protein
MATGMMELPVVGRRGVEEAYTRTETTQSVG